MIRSLLNAIAGLEKRFLPKRDPLHPSRLMGMYLDQANRPFNGTLGVGTRERHDGKFAQIRGRAGDRPL